VRRSHRSRWARSYGGDFQVSKKKKKSGAVEVVWDEQLYKALSIKGVLNSEIGAGLFQVGSVIMTDSKRNYVPVDTGELRRSGVVLPPEYKPSGEVVVKLGYGEEYAKIVHDRAPTIGQGKVKYLEKPLILGVNKYKKILATHVAKGIVTFLKTGKASPIKPETVNEVKIDGNS
jgi:hypothetical protein